MTHRCSDCGSDNCKCPAEPELRYAIVTSRRAAKQGTCIARCENHINLRELCSRPKIGWLIVDLHFTPATVLFVYCHKRPDVFGWLTPDEAEKLERIKKMECDTERKSRGMDPEAKLFCKLLRRMEYRSEPRQCCGNCKFVKKVDCISNEPSEAYGQCGKLVGVTKFNRVDLKNGVCKNWEEE